MRIGLVVFLLGCYLLARGATAPEPGWFRIWLGSNFVVLGIAHWRRWHRILGKRSDGTIPLWSRAIFLPYFLLTQLVWRLFRWLTKDPPFNDVTGTITIGRRLFPAEAVTSFDNYVDLTAEFNEPAALRRQPGYLCVPALDGSTPSAPAIIAALGRLRPGRTYVHCAQGYGRSFVFVIAMLLHSGHARTAEEAIAQVKAVRPRVRLSRPQREVVEEVERSLKAGTSREPGRSSTH